MHCALNKPSTGKSFDRLRTNGTWLVPFAVSLSNRKISPFLLQTFF
jgi:hypothetical protein